MWKFCGKAQFDCAFIQNFDTRKLRGISVFRYLRSATYNLGMSLLWKLKFCILTKWTKVRDLKLAINKQFWGAISIDLLNNFGAVLSFCQFIKKLYCQVHSEPTFAELEKEELLAQTNWEKNVNNQPYVKNQLWKNFMQEVHDRTAFQW